VLRYHVAPSATALQKNALSPPGPPLFPQFLTADNAETADILDVLFSFYLRSSVSSAAKNLGGWKAFLCVCCDTGVPPVPPQHTLRRRFHSLPLHILKKIIALNYFKTNNLQFLRKKLHSGA
jgi:hypothetical protein